VNWSQPNTKLGVAWVALSAAVALHVTDEGPDRILRRLQPHRGGASRATRLVADADPRI